MAHIVCITGGLTGILNASLGLVQQLQQAGHRVTYASPADLREAVTAHGIPYVQLDPWVMQMGDPKISRWAKLRSLKKRQQQAVAALGVQNFVATMGELAPDLLLVDIEMHPHIMAAIMEQLPVVLLCSFLSIWKRPNLPPIHTKVIPGQGRPGQRLGIEWSWFRYGWTKWKEFQQERWRRMGLDWISVLRCYAQQIGYPLKLRFGFNQWLVPFPDREMPVLCMNALELDFPHEPPPSMHYVGIMMSDRVQETSTTVQNLGQIYKDCQIANRPLIYCGLSSFAKADQTFLQQIIDAASCSPQWVWILGLGSQERVEDLGDLPTNLHVFSWAPQLEILKHTSCAIINSGINSINECISCGVPMLVYSLGCADQHGNAARVVYHSLGILGERAQDDATRICEHVQTLLTHEDYRINVNRMQARFRRYIEDQKAVKIVETLLREQKKQLAEVGT